MLQTNSIIKNIKLRLLRIGLFIVFQWFYVKRKTNRLLTICYVHDNIIVKWIYTTSDTFSVPTLTGNWYEIQYIVAGLNRLPSIHCVCLQYGIVLDAGSSHTAMFIYKWPANKQNGTGIVSQHRECHVKGECMNTSSMFTFFWEMEKN